MLSSQGCFLMDGGPKLLGHTADLEDMFEDFCWYIQNWAYWLTINLIALSALECLPEANGPVLMILQS